MHPLKSITLIHGENECQLYSTTHVYRMSVIPTVSVYQTGNITKKWLRSSNSTQALKQKLFHEINDDFIYYALTGCFFDIFTLQFFY